MRVTIRLCASVVAAAMSLATPAAAVTVYKTVDANGKVGYSDTAPAAGEAAEVIEVRDEEVRQDPADQARLRAMRETTDRLRADRLAREQQRQPAPQPWQSPSGTPPPPHGDDDDDEEQRWLLPYYPPYRHWNGGEHQHRPRPPYPRPPAAPTSTRSFGPHGAQEPLRRGD